MRQIGKNKRFLVLTLVIGVLTLSLIGARLQVLETVTSVFQKEGAINDKAINEYTITADFDPVEKILTASENITYMNKTDTTLDALYFHLYPNAFKTKEFTPFEKTEMDLAYPNGFESGYIQIYDIKSNEEPLNFVIMGLGDTILKVHLNKDLEPDEKINIDMTFQVKIPPSCGRFGYGENTVNIANWYPILSVFDDEGWNLEPYYAIGDPFYSDIGNYRVMISFPNEYTLASTGNLIKKEHIDGKVQWTLEAKNVRDFAMIASDKFKLIQDEVDGIKIYAYYFHDPFGDMALETARDCIKIFSDLFGMYPYKQFSVAASDFFIGGMEYPNLVYIDQSLYQEEKKGILEYVIAHETAHQWWYGIVGNDEVDEPWLDEALTEYSTLLYYEKKYGLQVKQQVFKDMIVSYYNGYRDSRQHMDESVCRSIDQFKDSREYQVLVYCKGAMFLEELRKQLGDEQFFQVMKVYFDKYKYKNANTANFIEVCEKVTNRDLQGIFETWLKYQKE